MVSVRTLREEKVMSLKPYNPVGRFKFWCQKVLPTVYDNSLSYYEVLNKLAKYLNDLIENVDTMQDNIDELASEIDDLDEKTEILNYSEFLGHDGYFVPRVRVEDAESEDPTYYIGWDEIPAENSTDGEYVLTLDVDGNVHTKEWKVKELVKYSYDEIVVGTWHNGKPIYQKTFHVDDINNESKTIQTNISNFAMPVKIDGVTTINNGTSYEPISEDATVAVAGAMNGNITITTTKHITDCYITIQYIKITD